MLWLLLGTLVDIWIACSMWTDAKRAKTGYQTSSDSILQVLINVALRCGASLAMYVRDIDLASSPHSKADRLASF